LSPDDNTLIALGLILKPRGLFGEVFIKPYRDNDLSLRLGLSVVIKAKNRTYQGKIENVKQYGRRYGVKFDDINSRDEAKNWCNCEVFCHLGDLPEKQGGEYYVFELIGLNVIDEQNKIFGKIREVLSMTANDMLVIDSPDGEVLVPFIREAVESVSIERQEVKIGRIRDFLL